MTARFTESVVEEAIRKVLRISSPSLVDANHEFHYYVVNGVGVEYLRGDGSVGCDPVKIVDFEEPDNNDWPFDAVCSCC